MRAGDLQMARFGHDIRIDKKGTIDLVTEVDLAVERMFRDLIAERFPDHHVLAEELGGSASVPPGPCWVFDPIDGTTNYAHGLPIFCASLALEIDGVAQVAAVYDPNRQRAVHGRARRRRVPERPAAPGVVGAGRWSTRCSSPDFPTMCTAASTRSSGSSARSSGGPGGAAARVGRDRPLLRRGGTHGRVLGERPQAVGYRRRRAALSRRRAGASPTWRARLHLARPPRAGHQRPTARRDARRDPNLRESLSAHDYRLAVLGG